ncbi:SDR family NAD(P)-dependent oxidoreductase [Rhodococcus jostii]|uniref:SDR family NAD(P)-dependent oxidoreductase n=1 Tax=Rhodococcus jostii TaxID=132919 RepID=UPI00362633B2
MFSLVGKIAHVTGAAQGIGAACVAALSEAGATVIASDITDIPQNDPDVQAERLDVRVEDDWVRVTDEIVHRHGRLDVLVNNAGTTGFDLADGPHDPEHASLATWRAVHATNLDGVFLGCKHAIRVMRPNEGGSIINISSRSGMVGVPRAAAYASSKAAVRNHTKTVAIYCAEERLGIRCNSVHPGAILTRMWEPMLGDGPDRDQRIAALVADTPLRRFGTPEEVAAAVVFLAADESAYMTGTELILDGGLLAGSASAIRGTDNTAE